MGVLGRLGVRTREPRCSVCRSTHSRIVRQLEERGLAVVGTGVGVCPTCRKAFCVDHMVKADPHDFMDNEKCPDDGSDLDLDWDKSATPEAPWRYGPKARGTKGLVKQLRHRDAEIRRDAAKALGEAGDASAVDALVAALDGPEDSGFVRAQVARSLGQIGDARAFDALVRALDADDDVLRRDAAAALGSIGDERAVEPLLRTLEQAIEHGDYQAGGGSASALGELGDRRAVEPLIRALGMGGLVWEEPAIEALGELGGPQATETLVGLLSHEYLSSRAVEALERIGGPAAEKALERHRGNA